MKETKMGLNVKDIQLRLFKVFHVSAESSYKFLQSHPKFSCVLLICLILYAFLSYIYTFLNYISPFLICASIFLRIFWSSEKTQLRYVKRDEEKKVEQQQQQKRVEFEGEEVEVEQKFPKILNNIGKRELLYKYPSQNATSRRRNFREKKWDVYGGLEEKAKNLSAVFQNEFTKRNTESFEKGESSLYYGLPGKRIIVPKRQTTLRSEPSMIDLVEIDEGTETEKMEEEGEDEEEEDEEDAREKERNKAIEWTEDDQKNLMDLGHSEMERNRRLESLIARRRARKLLKIQLENGLIDKKSMKPNLMAPLFIKRGNSIDDDLDMPGSAPVMPRSPYDIPYEPSEERPNLTGDGFLQEYHHKDMTFCRHESFCLEAKQDLGDVGAYSFHGRRNSDRHAYSRFRKLPDKGNHDWLIDQLMYNQGCESEIQESNPLTKGEESTQEDHEKCRSDMNDKKVEKEETSHETKSISDETNELIPNFTNVENVPEKLGIMSRFSNSHERLLNLPRPTRNTKTSNESMYENIPSPIDKRQETIFLTDGRLCHTPTYSIASDLQVEVSEIGSPTSTVDDDNVDTNSSADRDSVLYDGDIDRDVSSGSEDLWGTSFHGREARGVRSEDGIVDDISKEIVSPISLRQIDEENVADVSSYSSRSDLQEDTPTCTVNDDHNIFGYMNYSVGETEAPQYSNYDSVDQIPNETHSERQQEWCNLSENLTNESEVINDLNNIASIEQDNIENSIRNEDPGPSTSITRYESIDEASIYSISSSPRSVLPDKTITDDVSTSAFNQQMDINSQQSIIEDMTQESFNGESLHETMPQNIQPLMDDINNESHSVDFNHSQEQTNPTENSIEESNTFGNMNNGEILREEEQDKLYNEENSEDNSTTDDVPSSAFNPQMDIDAQQSRMGDTTQETLNVESQLDTMPQNIQPLMDEINNEPHNVDFNYSQEQTNPTENSIEESNTFGNMNDGEICREEEQDKLNNEENIEDNSTNQTNQEGTSESPRQINEMTTTTEDVDDKVSLVEDNSNEIATSGNINIHEELPHVPGKESNEGHAEDS